MKKLNIILASAALALAALPAMADEPLPTDSVTPMPEPAEAGLHPLRKQDNSNVRANMARHAAEKEPKETRKQARERVKEEKRQAKEAERALAEAKALQEEQQRKEEARQAAQDGFDYYAGDGRPQDYFKAFDAFQHAADLGSIDGYYGLAICYLEGEGTDRNYPAAVKYLTLASDQGDIYAMFLLGQCYERGRGVRENLKRAIELYRRSAARGNQDARDYLRKIGY